MTVKNQPFGRAAHDGKIIGRSNGHDWIKYYGLVCCCKCGTERNNTDTNKPCEGPKKIELRGRNEEG